MARNPDIKRAGMEDRVNELVVVGNKPDTIAKKVSEESGYYISAASVRRHMAKQTVNAAVTPEHKGLKMVAAALQGLADDRDTGRSAYYGVYQLNTTNCFMTYYGLARGIKNGQVLRAFKNIALKITNGAHIVGKEGDADKIKALSKSLNFSSLLQNVVRYICEMGTCLVSQYDDDKKKFTTPTILPIEYYSLLTESETVGTVGDNVVHGNVDRIVKDEMANDDKKKVFERDEIGLLRLWEGGNKLKDIHGRNTDGIYGESMTLGIETPLKSLLNGAYHWDAFLERYGSGRMVHNLKVLGELLKTEIVSVEQAQKTLEDEAAAGQKLGPNQDIFGAGKEVSMLETKTGFDIIPYFEWRKKQIDRALLQSDVGTGDVGSSWTSAGTAVSAQDYDTFKSLRETLFEQFFTEIIVPRCEENSLDPTSISIATTPFLQVNVPFQTLTEWVKMGYITPAELRDRGGFPEVIPDVD